MNEPTVYASVVMRRDAVGGRWGGEQWRVASVWPTGANIELETNAVRYDGHAIRLFRDEAEGYYLNLSSGRPAIFVHWRLDENARPEVLDVTLSYNEAARWLDSGEQVEHVPMPDEMHVWAAEFVAQHYKPEPRKRRRPQSFMTPSEREA
ncbi:MAG TPA: DUF3305 domain-containing protein [Burkholderiaceae bacterium]|nr:DUF3305 domain-containing protein [Burkholderiaceae bacterium]